MFPNSQQVGSIIGKLQWDNSVYCFGIEIPLRLKIHFRTLTTLDILNVSSGCQKGRHCGVEGRMSATAACHMSGSNAGLAGATSHMVERMNSFRAAPRHLKLVGIGSANERHLLHELSCFQSNPFL